MVSVSADGSIKQWNPSSGQVSLSQPAHTLGLVSLDVDATGRHALYNTLEGLTCLWNLENGEIVGKFESYARTAVSSEPGKYISPVLRDIPVYNEQITMPLN